MMILLNSLCSEDIREAKVSWDCLWRGLLGLLALESFKISITHFLSCFLFAWVWLDLAARHFL